MKLALLGGGGVRTIFFTQSLAKYAKRLGIDEVVIMDTNDKKLDIYGNLAVHIASTGNENLKASITNDVVSAVKNADYIVTTMRIAGDDGRITDEKIALKHGIIGQETTGPGGFSYALRTIPIMQKYCELIRQYSNNAIVFNFTNPSGLVTQAMHNFGYNNIIGICDGPTHLEKDIANTLNIDINNVSSRIYGLNHLSWMNGYYINDINIMQELMECNEFLDNSKEFGHFDKEVIRYVKGIPSSYLYYYYYRDEAVRNVLASQKTRGEVIKELNIRMGKSLEEIGVTKNPKKALSFYYEFIKERERSYMSIELKDRKRKTKTIDLEKLGIKNIEPPMDKKDAFEGYSGVAFNFIDAMRNNTGKIIPINVPNNNAIPELGSEDVLEISCRIDSNGAHPIAPCTIPEQNLLLMRQVKLYERLTVESIAKKSKQIAYFALFNHPLVGSYSLAKSLVDDYMKEFSEYFAEWK